MGFPSIAALNELEPDAFAEELASLFEGAQGFLSRLAAARPLDSDAALFAEAREVARSMPEADQLELLAAHPRIGAGPRDLSPDSYSEQGYGATPEDDDARVAEELAMLNEIYESRFGFRFVIFVAGRPLASLVPLLEASLRNDRTAELRRGLDDVIDIAADRLARARGGDGHVGGAADGV